MRRFPRLDARRIARRIRDDNNRNDITVAMVEVVMAELGARGR
ncbi:hypothetical protein [Dactylosporangium sp. NPDC005555]